MKILELSQSHLLNWGANVPEFDPCGIPTGLNYRPWHKAKIGKRGMSGNWRRIKVGTGSPQHSIIEAKALAKFDFHPSVLEARSQYPFWDREMYLRYFSAGRPFPKTSVASFDFMLTLWLPNERRIHYHSVSIKPSGQLEDDAVKRRAQREFDWCAAWGISWECLTEKDFPEQEYANHLKLRQFLQWAKIDEQLKEAREFAERVLRSTATGSLNHLLKCACHKLWDLHACYQMFAIAVFIGWIRLDHSYPLDEYQPLHTLKYL